MKQKYFKYNYYSKISDDSTSIQSNRARKVQVKLTGIERDKKGSVTLLLKRIG